MKSIVYLVILLLPLYNINGQILNKYYNKNNIEMRQLDINLFRNTLSELKQKAINHKNNYDVVKQIGDAVSFNQKEGSKEIICTVELDTIIKNVNYSEKDEKRTLYINGNELSGFRSIEKKHDSIVEERSEFYGNGTLKRLTYIEYYEDNPYKQRPIGVWLFYDSKENLIEQTEYKYDDELYSFTIVDVRNYIIKRFNVENSIESIMYNLIKSPRVIVNGEITQKEKWIVTIPEPGVQSQKRVIHIDTVTGQITHESIKDISK